MAAHWHVQNDWVQTVTPWKLSRPEDGVEVLDFTRPDASTGGLSGIIVNTAEYTDVTVDRPSCTLVYWYARRQHQRRTIQRYNVTTKLCMTTQINSHQVTSTGFICHLYNCCSRDTAFKLKLFMMAAAAIFNLTGSSNARHKWWKRNDVLRPSTPENVVRISLTIHELVVLPKWRRPPSWFLKNRVQASSIISRIWTW